jgi:hypothetical protein
MRISPAAARIPIRQVIVLPGLGPAGRGFSLLLVPAVYGPARGIPAYAPERRHAAAKPSITLRGAYSTAHTGISARAVKGAMRSPAHKTGVNQEIINGNRNKNKERTGKEKSSQQVQEY